MSCRLNRFIEPILVTRPTLPPLDVYQDYLRLIWQSQQLTNFGRFAREFEASIQDLIGSPNCLFVTNGTLALQLVLKALEVTGEVITTPFSFVATSSAIQWEGATPVLVDIDPHTLNLDPGRVEEAITPKTTAIVATHVYGNPCEIAQLESISRKHGLKLIFDAAHCVGVTHQGRALIQNGDASITSFHATKVFHSVEGGLAYFREQETGHRLRYMRNYGFNGPEDFQGLGINAKNSELHAAMGLALLPSLGAIIEKRLAVHRAYDRVLAGHPRLQQPRWSEDATRNGAYYPIILESEEVLLGLQSALEDKNVFTRRYFYPPLSRLPYVRATKIPVAENISRRVLCLPIYADLDLEAVGQIGAFIADFAERPEVLEARS